MRSNERSAWIVVSVSATAISLRSPGSVTAKNSRTGPAPSIRAASYSDCGIFCTPAVNSTIASPYITQIPISPTDGSASVNEPSQFCASPPSPIARSVSLRSPLLGS